MLYLLILVFITQNIILQKIIKYVVENGVFLFLWMSFMVLEIWLFGVGKVLEICFKDFVRTLGIA